MIKTVGYKMSTVFTIFGIEDTFDKNNFMRFNQISVKLQIKQCFKSKWLKNQGFSYSQHKNYSNYAKTVDIYS